ncbi:MAG: thiolase family protein [Alphaproteobacteria bacterium]|nr:thiolase family protein [Alphaproteobacteria bacterium]
MSTFPVPVVLAGYCRSPFTLASKGELAHVRADDLITAVLRGLVAHTKVDPAMLEDVLLGCAFPEGEQGFNLARLAGLMAGFPISVAGATINRFCGSSMQSVHMAAGAIQLHAGGAFVCAGVESMSRIPMGGFNPMPHPDFMKQSAAYMSMGETAENVASRFKISRRAQEEFALASHQKAAHAVAHGKLSAEIIPIPLKGKDVTRDTCIRAETTMERMAELKPAFLAGGSVTAATSSPLTDGASAVLVTSEAFADAHGLKKTARIRAVAVAGCDPAHMGMGPVVATRKALQRAGLEISQIDVVELNEAFASQALACMHELKIDPSRVNIDGGAIALGHPLGATGARITGKAAAIMQREGKQFALATQCIGGGQGIATILEAV